MRQKTADMDKGGVKVSPMLYGVFFEEIQRAGDGGLYAEMIQNRSFEDAPGTRLGWAALRDGNAEARISVDASRPLNTNNPTSLRLETIIPHDGRAGVANEGFKGRPQVLKNDNPAP